MTGLNVFRPTVLLYGLPADRADGKIIRDYLKSKLIRAVNVYPGNDECTLGELLQAEGLYPAKKKQGPEKPVLVMFAMQNKEMDALLTFLRENAPIELKAVVTPHNMNWKFSRLVRELKRERSMMTR